MSWIDLNKTLEDEKVMLVPMEMQHFEKLETVAQYQAIWEHYVVDMSTTKRRREWFANALKEKDTGSQQPYVIIDKTTNQIIGSTRLMDIVEKHKKLEIGSTWLHPNYWGTNINLKCKLLLLIYCFEELKVNRVLLKTDERNIRSQKAIKKTGAKFEGIIRNELIRYNGTQRNSTYFSIIVDEWDEAKEILLSHLNQSTQQSNKAYLAEYAWGDGCKSVVLSDEVELSIKRELMPVGAAEQLHFHVQSKQFFYVLNGVATFYVEDKKRMISSHAGLLIYSHEKHFVKNEGNEQLEFLVVSSPSTNTDRINV